MCEVWRSCLEPLGREGASCAAGVGGEGSHVGSNNYTIKKKNHFFRI